jgi:GMP synthase PP-ATPase subunit
MLNYLKDYFERGMMNIYSQECIDEMKGIVRDGGTIAAAGRSKDDRVIASALAAAAFAEQLQPRLIANRVMRGKKEEKTDENSHNGQVQVQKQVSNYLKALGF